jgi:hypothetical protein
MFPNISGWIFSFLGLFWCGDILRSNETSSC